MKRRGLCNKLKWWKLTFSTDRESMMNYDRGQSEQEPHNGSEMFSLIYEAQAVENWDIQSIVTSHTKVVSCTSPFKSRNFGSFFLRVGSISEEDWVCERGDIYLQRRHRIVPDQRKTIELIKIEHWKSGAQSRVILISLRRSDFSLELNITIPFMFRIINCNKFLALELQVGNSIFSLKLPPISLFKLSSPRLTRVVAVVRWYVPACWLS